MKPEQKIVRARAALVCDQPFFGALALRLCLEEDVTADTVWTDGLSLGYNPDFVSGLPMDHLIGIIAHEVMHLALCHHTRQGLRHFNKWNVAADYAVNLLLVKSGFKLPHDILLSAGFKGMSAEAIYDLLPDGDQDQNPESSMGEVRPMPGKPAPSPAENRLEEQKWKIAVSQAMQQAKVLGKLPGNGFGRNVKQALAPRVDWRVLLRNFMDQAVRSDYCWLKPNTRYIARGIYLPSLSAKAIGSIVVAIDTSGSVSESQLGQFELEIATILEEFDTTVTVVYADAKVQGHESVTQSDLPLKLTLKGGGGTDFCPVFEWVAKQNITPCCLAYLTDLGSSNFPDQAPGYPVLWINTEKIRWVDPPFGQVIDME